MSYLNLWLVAYIALGLVSGFLAGLLGIGGGLIIVAVLTFAFDAQGMPHAIVLPLALGTSMATIIFTSISSFRTHQSHGAVRWDLVRDITPGVIVGTLAGTMLAARASTAALTLFFGCFVLVIAAQMAFGLKPNPSRELPGMTGRLIGGGIIGAVSALVAIGGGSLTVPWLSWCNVRVQHAIGTSAAMGLPIALSGTAGYLWNGWSQPGLPAGAVGYVYLPALLCLLASSMLTAPSGARLAHRLPVSTLKRAFALLLVLLAIKMFWRILE
ncbi:MAG: sulfite exporter TauE/SafE family protein [Rhodocyclaceae bacterium]